MHCSKDLSPLRFSLRGISIRTLNINMQHSLVITRLLEIVFFCHQKKLLDINKENNASTLLNIENNDDYVL